MSDLNWIIFLVALGFAFIGVFVVSYRLSWAVIGRFRKYSRVEQACTKLFAELDRLPGHGRTTSATLNSSKYRIKVEALKR